MEAMCCPLGNGGDGDTPAFYEVDIVKARGSRKTGKEHCCGECGEVIQRGTKYERIKGKWWDEGGIDTFRTCLLCVEIRDHFACGNGWMFGEVWSQLQENFFPDMKCGGPCMAGLSPEAKRSIIDARMEWYMQDEHDGAPPPWWPLEHGSASFRQIDVDNAKKALVERAMTPHAEFDPPGGRQ